MKQNEVIHCRSLLVNQLVVFSATNNIAAVIINEQYYVIHIKHLYKCTVTR